MATPDLSEFDALITSKSRRACKVGVAKTALTGEDQAKLDAAIAERYPPGVIEKWLHDRGHDKVTTSAVVMHRNSKCACANERS